MKIKKGMIVSLMPKYQSEEIPLYFKVIKTKRYLHSPLGTKPFYGLSVSFVCSNDINNFPPEEIETDIRLRQNYPRFSYYFDEIFEPRNYMKIDRRKLKKA